MSTLAALLIGLPPSQVFTATMLVSIWCSTEDLFETVSQLPH